MTFQSERVALGGGRDEWGTPRAFFQRLHRVFRFDYDAFASEENALCELYSSVEGTFRHSCFARPPHASWCNGRERRSDLDGLREPWEGRRVFMNPPYSRGLLEAALRKASEERNNAEVIVALIPDNRDTGWWWDYVAPFAIDLPQRGRIQFVHPLGECGSKVCARDHKPGEETPGSPGCSSVVVYLPDWLRGVR